MSTQKNYGLGRGLSSLIPPKEQIDKRNAMKDKNFSANQVVSVRKNSATQSNNKERVEVRTITTPKEGVAKVNVNRISTNPFQPRQEFNEDKLVELANSIKKHGIIQPLVVTQRDGNYELIAGERRLQAAKKAGLKKVPIITKNVTENEKLELAITENIQRHDLNPIEEAKSFERLAEEFKYTQEEIAQKMGKSRSAIANKMRLLDLPFEAQKALLKEKITEGHAKIILGLKSSERQRALLSDIIKNKLTVRQAEAKINEVKIKSHTRKKNVDSEIKDWENKFSLALGTKTKLKKTGAESGKIIIDYYSRDDLESVLEKVSN